MRSLWSLVENHRRSALVFLIIWLGVLVLTVVTWIDEPEMRGMHPVAVVAHLLLPAVAGAVVGWWRRTSLRCSLRLGVIPLATALLVWLLTTPLPMVLQIDLAVVAALITARKIGLRGLGPSVVAGFVVFEANLAIQGAVGALFMGPPEGDSAEPWLWLAEMVEWALFLGGLGLLLGWLGGLVAGLAGRAPVDGAPVAQG